MSTCLKCKCDAFEPDRLLLNDKWANQCKNCGTYLLFNETTDSFELLDNKYLERVGLARKRQNEDKQLIIEDRKLIIEEKKTKSNIQLKDFYTV